MFRFTASRTIAFVVIFAFAGAACSGSSSSSNTTPSGSGSSTSSGNIVDGGQLRIGTTDGVDNTNPYKALLQDSYSAFAYIYPLLVQYGANGEFVPDFASSWTTSPDGKVWTFHTRPGAKWSDGQPLTAADVAFTLNTDMIKGSGSTGLVKNLTSAVASDDNTVVLTYDTPVSNVLALMEEDPIVPEHIWAKIITANGATSDQDKANNLRSYGNPSPIVSGGPFMLTKWKKDDIALFEKNPNYYGTAAHIDAFGLKQYSNEDAEISALKNNEIDAIESVPPNGLQPLKDAGFTISSQKGLVEDDFLINSSPNFKGFPELENPQVRTAFEYAIDKQNIVNTVWRGQAQVATSFLQPAIGKYFNTSLKPLGFNTDKANQILDGLGYTKGSDGIRVANGHPMSYTVLTPSDLTGINTTFDIIRQGFAKIGVKLTQKSVTEGAAWDEVQAPIDPKTKIGTYADYQLALWDWTGLTDPDFMLSVLTCESYSVWNDTGYCNKTYDQGYADQGIATSDKARRDIIWKMQDQIYQDKPYIMLDYENWISAWSSNWTGFVPDSMGIFGQLSTASLTNVHQVA